MARRGRPRKNSVKVVITLRLDPELDADLLTWLLAAPPRQRAERVKHALRQGGMQSQPGEADHDDETTQETLENILDAWNF